MLAVGIDSVGRLTRCDGGRSVGSQGVEAQIQSRTTDAGGDRLVSVIEAKCRPRAWSRFKGSARKRTPIRGDPISIYLERRRKGPIYPVIVAGGTGLRLGSAPYDPGTGEIQRVPFAQQSELCSSKRTNAWKRPAPPGPRAEMQCLLHSS